MANPAGNVHPVFANQRRMAAGPNMTKLHFIQILDGKAGSDWTAREAEQALAWWMEPEQERLVWIAATRYLGYGVTHEDIEDAWVAFYTQVLQDSLRSYKPVGPQFKTYALHVCFRNYCIKQGNQVRKRSNLTLPFTYSSGDSEGIEREIAGDDGNPEEFAMRSLLLDDVRRFLNDSSMSANQKKAFHLRYLEDKSNEEIANELNANAGSVRVWICRATEKVLEYLRQRGWAN